MSNNKRYTPPGPDGRFQLDRYLGRWYQVGQLPTEFQQSCARSIANYDRLPQQSGETVISVFNECLDSSGNVASTIRGTGTVVSDGIPPELIVSFPQFPSDEVNYVVRETDYDTYAIVGTFDNQSLFLLTRQEQIDQELFDYLLLRSEELGYNVDDLIIDQGAVKNGNHTNSHYPSKTSKTSNSNKKCQKCKKTRNTCKCTCQTCKKTKVNCRCKNKCQNSNCKGCNHCNDNNNNYTWIWWIIGIVVIIIIVGIIMAVSMSWSNPSTPSTVPSTAPNMNGTMAMSVNSAIPTTTYNSPVVATTY